MDNHIDTVLVCLHIHIEHVNHAISVDISEVEQVVDLLGDFLSRHEAERSETFECAGILMELRGGLRGASLCRSGSGGRDDARCLVANLNAV